MKRIDHLMRRMMVSAAVTWLLAGSAPGATTRYVVAVDPATLPPPWNAAYTNIQDALTAAAAGDTVLVADGIYTQPPYNANGMLYIARKNLTLRSVNGPAHTVIDGGFPGATNTCIYVTTGLTGTRIEGFTIRNGAQGLNQLSYGILDTCIVSNNVLYGGGTMSGEDNQVTGRVINCAFIGNIHAGEATGDVGGFRIKGRTGTVTVLVTNTLFKGNIGDVGGLDTAEVAITNCTFVANRGRSHGGGIRHIFGFGSLVRSLVASNSADLSGAGVYSNGKLLVDNCLIISNQSVRGTYGVGAGLRVNQATIVNCTFARNYIWSTNSYIKGCAIRAEGLTDVYNTIVYTNVIGGMAEFAGGCGKGLTFYNCSLQREGKNRDYVYYLEGNSVTNINCLPLGVDNRFVGAGRADYHLTPPSPCRNAGTNNTALIGAYDFDEALRIDRAYGKVDIGCYELHLPAGTMLTVR